MDRIESGRVLWVSSADDLRKPTGPADAHGAFALEQAAGIPEAIEHLKRSDLDAVIACFPIPEWSPDEVLDQILRISDTPVIIVDARAGLADAVRLLQSGAFHVFGAAASSEEISAVALAAIEERQSRLPSSDDEPWRRLLVGSSRVFEDVVRMVRLVSNRHSTVLITGETGTGKEMAARAIHMAGPRARLPMVALSCTALPENLLEAELFGHVRGAFTGAINQRMGRFEQANGSTLFLDEIGDMPLELQAKLLRVLQEREFQRLGSSETVHVDVRVIAATNADLATLVRQGRFREDLYYRLEVIPIHLPSLHERADDIPALVYHFIEKVCKLEKIPLKQISREALDRLRRYRWPGNVRQLENAVERAVVISGERLTLYPADFPLVAASPRPEAATNGNGIVHVPDDGLDFDETVGRIARGIIEQALRKTNGNKKLAADMLRLKRTTLAAKLRSLENGDSNPEVLNSDYVHTA